MSYINFQLQNPPKPVARINNKGEIIMIYPSQTDAASCTGADQSAISKVCRGKLKSINKMYFKSITLKEFRTLKNQGIKCSI